MYEEHYINMIKTLSSIYLSIIDNFICTEQHYTLDNLTNHKSDATSTFPSSVNLKGHA